MAAGVIKELLVSLGFQVDKNGLEKFNAGLQNATKRAAILAVAVTGVAATLGAGIVKVASASEAMGYLSEKSGASVMSLEKLGYAAEQLGVSSQTAQASAEGLGKFLKSLPGAEGFLRSVGVTTRDANGNLRDTGELLFDLGNSIKHLPRWRQEAVLGRAGVSTDMIRVLTADVGDLGVAFDKMYSVAGVDAQQAATSSREFMNELRTLKTLATMLARAISLSFVEKMRKDMARLRATIVENFDKIAKVFKFIIDLVMRVAGFFGAMAARVVDWIGKILGWFDKLDPSTQRLIAGIMGLVGAWKLLNLGFLASPLGIVLSLGVALAALVDDYQTWKEGGNSLIDWSAWAPGIEWAIDGIRSIIDWLSQFSGVIATAIGAFVGMKVVVGVFGSITGAIKGVMSVLKLLKLALVSNPIGLLVAGLAAGAALIIENWDTVKAWFVDFLNWFAEKWEWIKSSAGELVDSVSGFGSDIAEGADSLWQSAKGGFGLWGDDDEGNAEGTAPPAALLPSKAPLLPTGPALTPSPAQQMQFASSHKAVVLNQNTAITVAGSDNPQATGAAIAQEQRGVNSMLQRNMQGAAR